MRLSGTENEANAKPERTLLPVFFALLFRRAVYGGSIELTRS